MRDLLVIHDDDGAIHADYFVRCRDCKHGLACVNAHGEEAVQCSNTGNGMEPGFCHSPGWYCADGEADGVTGSDE